ncbi:MAG TPA: DUF2330 domain-containing protein [Candidatus Dormibacteraeota bacterium]|nr:DUF2330 domain-containing protein [Candidatus Dormibacteraeota bacterium]
MLRRVICGAAVAATLLAAGVQSVAACGGLVARNGAVRLARATTFVAWHDGVEHYLTSFAYQGVASDVGWIVPLPAIPTSVEAGGRWTLQRLVQEFSPPLAEAGAGAPDALSATAKSAQVIEQTTVEAVDLTVLKGSADEVLQWCKDNDFALNDETRAHIELYAKASPIFMAARYDVQKANALGRFQGDGTPVLITMPTPRLWVPLEVLANALDPVSADIFLLTDSRPSTGEEFGLFGLPATSVGDELPGAPGFVLQAQEPMSPRLHTDLSRDRNMSWVPGDGWVTHLVLDASSPTVDYDMTVSPGGDIRLVSFALPFSTSTPHPAVPVSAYTPQAHIAASSLAALIALALAPPLGLLALRRRRRRSRAGA